MTRSFIAGPASRVSGTLRMPGDKSISHRGVMLSALAAGPTEIRGFLPSTDCLATLAAFEAMGVAIDQLDPTTLRVQGVGLTGLSPPATALDLGNSGTAMRLLAGVLCGQSFDSILIGDASLSRRPMERVAEPLQRMGAEISTTDGCPPLRISGGQRLIGINYALPVASAQVKSAILLAGLYAHGETSVREPAVTRDHTERMLSEFGWPVRRDRDRVIVDGGGRLQGGHIEVPGDLSSAAFFVLAACLARDGEVVIEKVGLNPTRTGFLRILELMGADVEIRGDGERGREPVGEIRARPSRLRGIRVPPELVPLAIDELPLVFMAAALADGQTLISGAEELRHKESDRIATMVAGFKALGVRVEERADGARIIGGRLAGGTVDSAGDHRIAMAFAVGAVRAQAAVRVLDTQNVATSFPNFVSHAQAVGLTLDEVEDASEH